MSKLEKLNRIRTSLIIFILVLLLVMFVAIFFLAKKVPKTRYYAGYKARSFINYQCLKKGEVCTYEDIMNSIKVSIPVNENEVHDFYLIANDENTATFIMDSNIKNEVDWHIESINFRGPTKAIRELMAATKDWTNVPQITSFKYEDAGNAYYHDTCDTIGAQANNLLYDCRDNVTPARGYQNLEIKEDGVYLKINLPKDSTLDDTVMFEGTSYARLPSFEDLNDIVPVLEYPDWLIDNLAPNSGYWTMTSSTFPTLNYNQGAYALVNQDGEPRLIEIMTMNESNPKYNNIGIRPIITINK